MTQQMIGKRRIEGRQIRKFLRDRVIRSEQAVKVIELPNRCLQARLLQGNGLERQHRYIARMVLEIGITKIYGVLGFSLGQVNVAQVDPHLVEFRGHGDGTFIRFDGVIQLALFLQGITDVDLGAGMTGVTVYCFSVTGDGLFPIGRFLKGNAQIVMSLGETGV